MTLFLLGDAFSSLIVVETALSLSSLSSSMGKDVPLPLMISGVIVEVIESIAPVGEFWWGSGGENFGVFWILLRNQYAKQ
jgi:hypothetical protein